MMNTPPPPTLPGFGPVTQRAVLLLISELVSETVCPTSLIDSARLLRKIQNKLVRLRPRLWRLCLQRKLQTRLRQCWAMVAKIIAIGI